MMIDKRNAARMNIFFCADSYAIEGLGIALVSMLRNCSNSECLKIWILCSNTIQNDKENIKQLLIFENFKGEIAFVDFDAEKEFSHYKNFYGNKMTYGRLLIPNILKTGNAFYLDCDLVINLDILELQNYISDMVIGAVQRRRFYETTEKELLINKLNLAPDTSYFNAGLLIINVDKWHQENFSKKILELGIAYKDDLHFADQTLLNILCNGNYTKIPEKCNYRAFRSDKLIQDTHGKIIHFVGLPKPWDILGKLHKNYQCWQVYQTPFWKDNYKTFTKFKMKKAWGKKIILIKLLLESILLPNNDDQ